MGRTARRRTCELAAGSGPDGQTARVSRSLLKMPPVVSPSAVGAPDQAGPTDPARRRWLWSARTWMAVVLACLLVAALAIWRLTADGPAPLDQSDVNRAVKSGVDQLKKDQRAAPPDAATAYRRIGPSLVTVTTERAGS